MAAAVVRLSELVATRRPFVVHGESGAGVGWSCRGEHEHSGPAGRPFIEVHPDRSTEAEDEQSLRAASGGTLLVRQFDTLSVARQERFLLPAPDTQLMASFYSNGGKTAAKCVDATVLAAFAGVVEIPPLRARREDIAELATWFTRRMYEENGLPLQALTSIEVGRLERHDWPGNVRELWNTRAVRTFELHNGKTWDELAFLERPNS